MAQFDGYWRFASAVTFGLIIFLMLVIRWTGIDPLWIFPALGVLWLLVHLLGRRMLRRIGRHSAGEIAEDGPWPPLAKGSGAEGPATQDDVQAGRAVFALDPANDPRLLEIELPQYAWLSEDGKDRRLVSLIQAESAGDLKFVGYF